MGIQIASKAPRVSHLLYADDILIFSEANLKKIKKIKKTLNNYCKWTGQRVNFKKSMMVFGKTVNQRRKKEIENALKFSSAIEMNYLAIKLTLRRMVSSDYNKLMEVALNKLNIRGKNFISLEGKMVLLKSAFLSLPIFLSTLSLVPLGILKEFDKMCRDFLWNKKNGNLGLHSASWKELCKPKQKGGRGLFSAVEKVGHLRAKFAWKFYMKPESLLICILKAKYGDDLWKNMETKGSSSTWRIICNGAKFFINIVRWKICNGISINWLKDAWILDRNISKCPTFVSNMEINNYKLEFFLKDGEWNLEHLQMFFGKELIDLILKIPIFINQGADQIDLKKKASGCSVAAISQAYFYKEDANCELWKRLKNVKLRPNVVLFWWRMYKNAIPSFTFLFYRKITSFTGCPRGCKKDEDNNHIAGECDKLKKVIFWLNKWGIKVPQFVCFHDCLKELERMSYKNPLVVNIYCNEVFLV
ncbi:uncharacterized protein LOC114580531 [Dendrobium catenatum]|uniref:uncharacterized protein LOC114580531 n=1 Tax=Dendrobium catenatum TaxID=906689 RepID=UPI00109F7582|nr:uncharacterized protein LOC114580531 [Dendrobium catenatum]